MIRARLRTTFDRQQQREMLRRAEERAEDKRFADRKQWAHRLWAKPDFIPPMMLSCFLLDEYARLYGCDEGWERI